MVQGRLEAAEPAADHDRVRPSLLPRVYSAEIHVHRAPASSVAPGLAEEFRDAGLGELTMKVASRPIGFDEATTSRKNGDGGRRFCAMWPPGLSPLCGG